MKSNLKRMEQKLIDWAHKNQRDCWNALTHAIELFRRISTETATKCGFTLSELDRTITEYILKMEERS